MTTWNRALDRALTRAREITGGCVTDVYPTLAAADPELLAVAVHPLDGTPAAAGQARHEFILMSAAKPFVVALAADLLGTDAVVAATGMRETGRAFNDVRAIHEGPAGRTNPMVNPGAITAASLLGSSPSGRDDAGRAEACLREGLAAFAGRELHADAGMVDAIQATNHHNRALAVALADRRLLATDLETALHLYTLQSCLAVTVGDLARMGAVLAGGGTDPVTGARVVSADAARLAIDAMALAGLYEGTRAWMDAVGAPAKSGISGAMVAVTPTAAIAAFSPRLDERGNPLQAQAAIAALVERGTRRMR